MKKLIAGIVLGCLATGAAFSDEYVSGYYKKDGTYVSGHTRSSPNANRYDNYGSQSNGGSQRDEYSGYGGATNKRNPGYNSYDNDSDGIYNGYDRKPESKKNFDWD